MWSVKKTTILKEFNQKQQIIYAQRLVNIYINKEYRIPLVPNSKQNFSKNIKNRVKAYIMSNFF